MSKDKENKNLPIIIHPECHFLELPFFSLSWRGLNEKSETVFRYEEVREGEKGIFEWHVTSNVRYGYPTPFDRRTVRAIDAVIYEKIRESGYPVENPISFSIYHLADLMRSKTRGGRFYQDIKQSLIRIVATTVESRGSFWLKDKKRWIHDVFHLYDKVRFAGEETEDGDGANTNYLWLGEFILRNINSRHVRPLNYLYLASLKSDIAGRLYELLSGKFYGLIRKGGRNYNIDYSTLCQLLPIALQRYLSKAEEKLRPAHEELIKTGFLKKVEIRKGKNGFVVVYFPGERAEELIKSTLPNEVIDNQMLVPFVREKDENIQLSDIGQKLHSRGLSRSVAVQFCGKYPEKLIHEKIEMFELLREKGSDLISKNPAGWLRKAIEEDWKPSGEQQKAREIQARTSEEREQYARWMERRRILIEQELNKWDDTPSEERIKPRLEAWKMVNSGITEEELEKRKQEYIDGLPKTDVEKQEYLSRNYPDHPPEDFK